MSQSVETMPLSYGLNSWNGVPALMHAAHRHNDLELNYLEQGAVAYRFGTQHLELQAGDSCLFWAAVPHQLVANDSAAYMYWLTLPLALFLRWQLPQQFRETMLHGSPLQFKALTTTHIDSTIRQWHNDLTGGAERRAIVQLELEAFIRRVALANTYALASATEQRTNAAQQMAQFIAEHAAEPLTVTLIASQVALHPHYAMAVFRRSYGVTLMEYVMQHRIARAQQLLATTERGILAIALESGFGSVSRFHSAFKAACGLSPAAYRSSLLRASL